MIGREAVTIKIIIDSKASAHMVWSKKEISSPMQSVQRGVVLGGGRYVFSDASGSTTIYCITKGSKPVPLNDVLVIPSLDTNFLSCSEMDDQRYEITFKGGKWFLTPPGEEHHFFSGVQNGGVYEPNGDFAPQEEIIAAKAPRRDSAEAIWRLRLGHIGRSKISRMVKGTGVQWLTTDNTLRNVSTCSWCIDEKQTRSSLKERKVKADHAGEVVHSDVGGTRKVRSIRGKIYFVTFVDAWPGLKSFYLMSKR